MMSLREHKLWTLIEEVGLKKAYISISAAGRVPGDINELRQIIRTYIPLAKTNYEEVIKYHANDALKEYSKMQSWLKEYIPKGWTLYNYGLPPAIRRLYEALKKQKKV